MHLSFPPHTYILLKYFAECLFNPVTTDSPPPYNYYKLVLLIIYFYKCVNTTDSYAKLYFSIYPAYILHVIQDNLYFTIESLLYNYINIAVTLFYKLISQHKQ